MVRSFIPQKLADATKQGFLPPQRTRVMHSPAIESLAKLPHSIAASAFTLFGYAARRDLKLTLAPHSNTCP